MSALNKKSVKDIDVSGKRVLVRCDFNVPLQDGKITSDKRIVASLPTIKYLIDHHAKVILCSHLGRPKGEFKPEFSLAPVAARLSELGYETVILNPDSQLVNEIPNSRLYQEPLDIETLEKIIDTERPDCVLPIFGGKIAMTLCHELAVSGILSKYDIKQPGVSMYATTYTHPYHT